MNIDPTTLAPVGEVLAPRGRFFGPCSGHDLPLAFQLASNASDRFTFCDLAYARRDTSAAYAVPEGWTLISRIDGRDERQPVKLTWYNGRRPIYPSACLEVWRRPDNSECYVELRRDLAEDVLLQQFAPRSISFFMHLNDGACEGGSDLWFLSVGGMPSGRSRGQGLLGAVIPRLMDGAVVITDAALAEQGFQAGKTFTCLDVQWTFLGTLPNNRRSDRPVFLWRAEGRVLSEG